MPSLFRRSCITIAFHHANISLLPQARLSLVHFADHLSGVDWRNRNHASCSHPHHRFRLSRSKAASRLAVRLHSPGDDAMASPRSSSLSPSSTSCVLVVVYLMSGLLFAWSELAGAEGFEPLIRLPSFRRGARRSRTMRAVSVVDLGARGNGLTDDTEAFVEAWKLACSSKVGAILVIPAGNAYLLRPINFGGPCKSKVVFLVMGTIIAPSNPDIWLKQNPRRWLYFHGIKDLEVRGEGVVDGMGQEWWARSCKRNASNPCRNAPSAMTFHRMRRLTVQDLTLVNSQKMHMAFTNCFQVQVSHLKVIAPERSPNTDGIHISSSVSVAVEDSIIGTGLTNDSIHHDVCIYDSLIDAEGSTSPKLITNMPKRCVVKFTKGSPTFNEN